MKKPKRKIEYEDFLLEVIDWHCFYSISLGRAFRGDDPYLEHQGMEVDCRIIAPSRFKGKLLFTRLISSRHMDDALNDPDTAKYEPLCVGSLTIRGKTSAYLGSLPQTTFILLIQLLSLERIRFISFHGEKLRYGSANISNISFDWTYEPEDYD